MEKTEVGALREVVGTASADTSAAFSALASKRVEFAPPTITVASIGELPELVGGPKKLVVGTYLPIKNGVLGNVVVTIPKESAFLLVDLSENKKLGTTQVIDEKGQKLINEIGLAIISGYKSALDTLFEFKIIHETPKFFSTFGESITDFISLGFGEAERIFLNSFKISFGIGSGVKGEFTFLITLKPIDSLLRAIRSKYSAPGGE